MEFFNAHDDNFWKSQRTCKNCGAKISFIHTRDKAKPCHICGNLVYKNDKIEFEENLKKRGIKKV